jgi:PAS domain S-box-containing protein
MSSDRQSASGLAPKFPLSLLLVENNPLDAQFYIDSLSRAQFDLSAEVARTPEEFVEKLQLSDYDIILADYQMGSSWTGMDALDLLQEEGHDIPFILLTAPLGDQIAVDYMKSGLADYVLKDRLDRLPVAIYRALEQRAARNEHLHAERALEQAENKFHALAESMPSAVFLQIGTNCTYVNRAAEAISGFRRSQLMQMSFWQMITEAARPGTYEQIHRAQSAELPVRCQTQITTKWGTERWLDCHVKVLQMEGGIAALITAVPIAGPGKHARSSEQPIRPEKAVRFGPAQTPSTSAPGRSDFRLPGRRPVPVEVDQPLLKEVDSSIASESYGQAERDADDHAADQRAADQLEAILRAHEAKVDVTPKGRPVKTSYVQ